ncbi:MAG: cobalt ECF transporter T component CbiQ [Candidatus Actinomarina sp.]
METSHHHHLEIHNFSKLNAVKPQTKLLVIFLIILSIAFYKMETLNLFFIHVGSVIYLLIISKITFKTYIKRLSIDIPFVLFAFFLPFISKGSGKVAWEIMGLAVYETGLIEMRNLIIKITLCVTLAIILTATTSTVEIIYGMQKLKISPLLISIFSFAIRYIDVFIDELKRVKTSMKSRGYSEKGLKNLKPIAFASGAMLIRGYERGERVYNSMISRGFNGYLELHDREYISSNTIFLIGIFCLATTIFEQFVI